MDLMRVTPAEVIPAQQVNQERELLQVVMRAAQDPDIDPARLQEFLAMGERLEAIQAKKAYNQAWAAMAPALPYVAENGLNTFTNNRYAKWDDIHRACMPVLGKFGFSVSFDSRKDGETLFCIVVIRHISGHEERPEFAFPWREPSKGRSAADEVAVSLSKAMRHAFRKAFNILSIGEEERQVHGARISEEVARRLEDMLTAGEDKEPGMRARFMNWAKAELLADRIRDLYVSQLPRVQAVLAPKGAK